MNGEPNQIPIELVPPELENLLTADEQVVWYGPADKNLVLQRTLRYWVNVIVVMGVLTWYVHESKGIWWWSTYNLATTCWALFMVALALFVTILRHRMSAGFSVLLTNKQVILHRAVLFSKDKFRINQWPVSATVEAYKLWSKRVLLRVKDPETGKIIRWTTEPLEDVDAGVAAINSLAAEPTNK